MAKICRPFPSPVHRFAEVFFNFLGFGFFIAFFAPPHYGSWCQASLIKALKNEMYRTSIALVSSHHRNFISLTVYTVKNYGRHNFGRDDFQAT